MLLQRKRPLGGRDDRPPAYCLPPPAAALRAQTARLVVECDSLAASLGYGAPPAGTAGTANAHSIAGPHEEAARVAGLIARMHAYNEVKDVAQALIGRIAARDACRAADLYPRFGLLLDD